MKKTVAALVLCALALAPATSAWADGSSEDPGSRELQHHVLGSAPDAEWIIAYGCHQGVVFVIDFGTGVAATGGECSEESLAFKFN